MISRDDVVHFQQEAYDMFTGKARLVVTPEEKQRIEIADLGLSEFHRTGLAILVYVNTQRCCAKELAMWPRQTCPEHRHPDIGAEKGKEETFRCRWGKVFLYVSGAPAARPQCRPPGGPDQYTVWHEIELNPGDQYTIMPDTLHWFQSGDEGAVVSEFSTRSTDEHDVFTDQRIARFTRVVWRTTDVSPVAVSTPP